MAALHWEPKFWGMYTVDLGERGIKLQKSDKFESKDKYRNYSWLIHECMKLEHDKYIFKIAFNILIKAKA